MEIENKAKKNIKNYFFFLFFLLVFSAIFSAFGILHLKQVVREAKTDKNKLASGLILKDGFLEKYLENHKQVSDNLAQSLNAGMEDAKMEQVSLLTYSRRDRRSEIGAENIDLTQGDLAKSYQHLFDDLAYVKEDKNRLVINFKDDGGKDRQINLDERIKFSPNNWNGEIKISSDEKKIALSLENASTSSVYLITDNGIKIEKIDESSTVGVYFKPISFSEDKKYFYYSLDTQGREVAEIWPGILGKVYRYDLATKKKDDIRLLATNILSSKYNAFSKRLLAISSNDRYLAFELDGSVNNKTSLVVVVDLASNKVLEFPLSSRVRGVNAFFSSDNKQLAFNEFSRLTSGLAFKDNYKLRIVELSGSGRYDLGDNYKILGWLDSSNLLIKENDGAKLLVKLVD